jgi:hypothetical protein
MGARVVMVCRTAEKGKAALEEIRRESGSSQVDLLIADMSSQSPWQLKTSAPIFRRQLLAARNVTLTLSSAAAIRCSLRRRFVHGEARGTLVSNHERRCRP